MYTITYNIDNNSPLTPNASLILGRTGGDAEEARLRKNFDGLWDDEEAANSPTLFSKASAPLNAASTTTPPNAA